VANTPCDGDAVPHEAAIAALGGSQDFCNVFALTGFFAQKEAHSILRGFNSELLGEPSHGDLERASVNRY
jgi:hypothetical protein